MPASLTRNEYYWEDDRLIHEPNRRSSVYRPFRPVRGETRLVAAIEDRGKQKKISVGPASTRSRIAHAILREERLAADPQARDIGLQVPSELVKTASAIVESAVREVTRQYGQLSNEERRTGALSFDLNRQGVIEHEGWELTVILQGFSTQTKEPEIGADVGIVVDLKKGAYQVSKGLWAQAKDADVLPAEPLEKLDRFESQMADMLERTDDAYGIIYTPNGVHVFQGRDSQNSTTLDAIIAETVECRRGDRSREFLADTVHREYLIEMAFQDERVRAPRQTWLFE